MKINPQAPAAMKCLGRKLELTLAGPDPGTFTELTKEYNCKECADLRLCLKLLKCVEVK